MNASGPHDAMLDDVAVYALGALPEADAARVREHLAGCAECRAEYAALRPAASAVAYSAEACESGQNGPHVSALLKPRIMRAVRADLPASPPARAATGTPWAAYLVAAACLAVAIVTSAFAVSLDRQLASARNEAAAARVAMADLASAGARRYATPHGAIVASAGRIYIAMHDMPMPPKGHVYQAWTLPKGSKRMAPSVTFMPQPGGAVLMSLPQDARATAAVAVSVEPDGGSAAPTTKPVALVALN